VSWRYFESPLLDVGHMVGYTESLKALRHVDRGSEQLGSPSSSLINKG
jgi:hypothetical protein